MNTQAFLEYEWPYLLSFLPSAEELERTAREWGALRRRRGVASAEALLRLALAYGFCGFSLRRTAAWAQAAQVADISDVALLKRLRKAADWLGFLVGNKLAERAATLRKASEPIHLRIVDATSISRHGSRGTDWRVHLDFDLDRLSIGDVEVTDAKGAESLTRFEWRAQDLVIADRGYVNRRGLESVVAAGAHFLVRLNWRNLPLLDAEGARFDLLPALRSLPDAAACEFAVRIAHDRTSGLSASPYRLVAVRKSEAAAERSRRHRMRVASKKGHNMDPRTLEAAGYVFVLTSAPAKMLSTEHVLDLYRFRWQIELAFKRMKSLLHLGDLPVKDPALARSVLYAKLLAALILEDLTDRFLAFSPWGYRLARPSALPVAHPAGPA
jgi:hypothetical protein